MYLGVYESRLLGRPMEKNRVVLVTCEDLFSAGPAAEDLLLESFLDVAVAELLDVSTPSIMRCQILQTLSLLCCGKPKILRK